MKIHSLFWYGRRIFCPVLVGCALLSTRTAHAHQSIRQTTTSFFYQKKQITGTVSDSSIPLAGVTVSVKGKSPVALTDSVGKFNIEASPDEVLVFSYIGYQTLELALNGKTVLDIRLTEDTRTLQEVEINAGYYSVKESERTGSISRITSKAIETQPVTNVLAAMQGRMAGKHHPDYRSARRRV